MGEARTATREGTAVQVTDWIPCETPPIREGWYEVEMIAMNGARQKIRRYFWGFGNFRLGEDCLLRAPVIENQDRWRGLTQPEEA